MALHNNGDYKGSLKCFTRQAQLGHEAPTAMYNQGCARARLGDKDGAIMSLHEAAELGFSYPPAAEDEDLESLKGWRGFDGVIEALTRQETLPGATYSALGSGADDAAHGQLVDWLRGASVPTDARELANTASAEAYAELAKLEAVVRQYEEAMDEGPAEDDALAELADRLANLEQRGGAESKVAHAEKLVRMEEAAVRKQLERALANVAKARTETLPKELEKRERIDLSRVRLLEDQAELEQQLKELDARRAELEKMILKLKKSRLQ